MIESVLGEKFAERLAEEDQETRDTIVKFDAELSSDKGGPEKHSDVTSFCSGIIVALGVVIVSSIFSILLKQVFCFSKC